MANENGSGAAAPDGAAAIARATGGRRSELYTYVGQRVLAGGVPYVDAWEQKPPGIFFTYAFFWRLWPAESMVAAADLVAAGLVAWLLIVMGRQWFTNAAGYGAAVIFLALGDPGLQRLSGLMVRAQCETFIALAVTMALVLTTRPERRPWHLPVAGAWLAVAVWLKYNAVVYALPIAMAVVVWPPPISRTGDAASKPSRATYPDWRRHVLALGPIAAGFGLVSCLALLYFGLHGALGDLYRATIGYNLQYSGETYGGPAHAVRYLVGLPVDRARVDGLWFVGGLGALCLLTAIRRPAAQVTLVWLAAALLSIAINGSRGLPQYFIQAGPALALAAGGGIASVWSRSVSWKAAIALLIVAGAWRVGDEPGPAWRPRLFGAPELVDNIAFDVSYWRGRVPRATYLERFGGTGVDGKFSALAVEALAEQVRRDTRPQDRIYVFGFASGGVYAKSGRWSSSRFFWSRPVVIEFDAATPGYGSAGLLADLEREPPAIVALQKRDWRLGEAHVPNSIEFFLGHAPLRTWLETHYVATEDGVVFAVWRKKS